MSAPTAGPSKPRKRDKVKQFFGIDRSKGPIPPPPATTTKETRSRSFEGVKTVLETVVSVGDAFPPLKSTAAGMLVILKAVEAYGENREEFRKLLDRLEVLSEIMTSCPANVPQGVGDRFSGLARIVEEKKDILERRLDPNRSSLERVILSPQDKEEVLKITQEIRFAIEIALFKSTFQNEVRTLQVVDGVGWLKDKITVIEDASGAIRGVERDIKFLRRSELLKKLGDVEGAEYSNPERGTGCTPGSRLALLAMLLVWATDPTSPHVFWLSGPAGTGKTAVSKTLCAELDERRLLGGSFFCTLKERDLQDVYLIIPTLARILAETRPDFGSALQDILESDHKCRTPTKMTLDSQYTKLIHEPAEKVFQSGDLLVICIDALDECKNTDAIAQLLTVLLRTTTRSVKFMLTSRPEIALRESFESSTIHRQLRLYDIEDHIVRADVILFLTERFRNVRAIYQHYEGTWPPPEIEQIADFSGKLFIVAFTAFKYITAPNGVSIERFKEFNRQSDGIEAIDSLYSDIMDKAFKGLKPREQELVHSCLSLLVSAQHPLSPHDYGRLLGKDIHLIREAFKALHAVVQVPEEGVDDGSISIYHASFVDYVISHAPREQKWAVEKSVAHAATGDACFRIMDLMLCFGISGAQTSYLSNNDQPTPLNLSSELAYACTSWGEHVVYAGFESEARQQKVEAFLNGEAVWYWLEALSAIKAVNYGYSILWKISKAATSTELQTLSNDLGDFVHTFEAPISHSTPHLYLSATPFSSALSREAQISFPTLESVPIVHHRPSAGREILSINLGSYMGCSCLVFSPDGKYIAAAVGSQKLGTYSVIVYTRGGHHAPEIPAMMHPHRVRSVAYSPNGRCIASASTDGAIRIWDAQTGMPASEPLQGHTDTVWAVAYSPDSTYIASGSADKTIRLWDAQTGLPVLQPSTGHTGTVCAVAYSPDGKYIVSGSADDTLRVWDAQTGRAVFGPITGHTDIVRSVAYSPDGNHIVSGSYDRTVRIWDAHTGQAAVGPMRGHTDKVRSVAFSPDGRFVVSCSDDKTVQIWDARTGEAASERFDGHTAAVVSVVYSPDGKCIATGALDNTIRFWDARMDRPASDLAPGHSAAIWAVAYSPDGKFLASGSGDGTVRVWDAQTGDLSFPPIRMDNNMPAISIAYSPDGEYFVSGSEDGTVRLWHARTGKPASDAMSGHRCVAFSPDGSTIASASGDKTVRLWDARTGEPRDEPLTGHTNMVNAVAWSPDGKHLVSGANDNTVRVWDLTGAQRVFEPMTGHTDTVWSVAYSPDGRHIASGSGDKTIRIWDAGTRQPVGKPITGHTEAVRSVVYSPNGSCIASGSTDRTIRLWDAQTGVPLFSPIIGHGAPVISVASSPTDGRIASGSMDITLRIWKLPQENPTQMPRTPPTLDVPVYLHDYPHGVYTVGSDGWIRNSAGHLLLWVPLSHRTGLYCGGLERIIGNIATTKVELTKAIAHGENWLMCRDPPSHDEAHNRPWPV
ncbi:hypothetical protein D9611_006656 [Ephemerocybe angulata]|uniref:WD40 repeat-like protein n=1 Tax=Ephemerocybe angulata TaxID=980116 RepID=A0A8H5C755_9AGAR|nr:hypothetical protein D9611_006656 [Tulosesus angulatus]